MLQEQLVYEFTQKELTSTKHLLRFSFDNDDELSLLPSERHETLLSSYFTNIIKQHPARIENPVLIALDEIQNVAGWQAVVKSYYDLDDKIKFIITGSSSLSLHAGSESLAGRAIDVEKI